MKGISVINRAYRFLVRFVGPVLGLGFFAHAAVARADDPIGDVFALDILVAVACALFAYGWVHSRVSWAIESRRDRRRRRVYAPDPASDAKAPGARA